MSTDPKPDPFAELRNLLSENARLRARVEVLEYRAKIGHAPHDHDAVWKADPSEVQALFDAAAE